MITPYSFDAPNRPLSLPGGDNDQGFAAGFTLKNAETSLNDLVLAGNALWSASLMSALACACVGTFIKQSVRRRPEPNHISWKDKYRVWENKLQTLRSVPLILAVLPVLIRTAMTSFLVGLALKVHAGDDSLRDLWYLVCALPSDLITSGDLSRLPLQVSWGVHYSWYPPRYHGGPNSFPGRTTRRI